jgi:hypothetical protein
MNQMTQDLISIPSRQLGRAGLDRLPARPFDVDHRQRPPGSTASSFRTSDAALPVKVAPSFSGSGGADWGRLRQIAVK